MFWFALVHLVSFVVDLVTIRQLTEAQKDIQILLLRQQVRVLPRKARQPKRFSRLEKTLLAVLVGKMGRATSACKVEKPYLREDSSGVAIVIMQNASENVAASYDSLRSA